MDCPYDGLWLSGWSHASLQAFHIQQHTRDATSRLSVDVDDPLSSVRGRGKTPSRSCTILLTWLTCGSPLAVSKATSREREREGEREKETSICISCIHAMKPGATAVKAPEGKIARRRADLGDEVVLGNTMQTGSVIFVWGPFVSGIWAAMQAAIYPNAQTSCF